MAEYFSPEEKYFLSGLKPTIFIGNLLGLFPKHDIFGIRGNVGLLAYSGTLTSFLTVNAFLMLLQFISTFNTSGRNFMEKLGFLTHIGWGCSMAFVYLYHFFLFGRFQRLLHNFRLAIHKMGPGCLGTRPSSFPLFCWLVILVCLTFGAVENVLYDMQEWNKDVGAIKRNSSSPGKIQLTPLYLYYCNYSHWHDLIPTYYPAVTAILVGLVKVGSYGWIFTDTIIVLLCHSLALNFRWLNETIKTELITNDYNLNNKLKHSKPEVISILKVRPISLSRETTFTWEDALDHYWLLADLTLETERYVGPIIFTCSVSVGHVLVILFAWIGPDIPISLSAHNSAHVYCSTLFYCWRVGLVIYYLSQVHFSSEQILETVERCSGSSYIPTAGRLERKLVENPAGIRLCGTFLITRYFIVSLTSFIFTTEIVLLQMANVIIKS